MRAFHLALLVSTVIFGQGVMNAQATRTWVSGVGDDANPCSRTAPCKTFAGAISKTAAGGEIDVLDPGGFGVVTITKAMTIDGGTGLTGSILAAGTNGVVVNAGVADNVVLRNLSINGVNGSVSPGLNGVRFLAGKSLRIENCNIMGFSNRGIDISVNNASGNPPTVSVVNSTVNDNSDSGIRTSVTKRVLVSVTNSRFNNNGVYGVYAGDYSRLSVDHSDVSGNGTAGLVALANAGDVVLNVTHSTATNNSAPTNASGAGVQAGGGSALSVVRLYDVVIMSNFPNGMVTSTNGSIVSFGLNANAGTGTPTSNSPLQ